MSRRLTTEVLTELNTMCEKLFALPRYHMMKYKRCVELAVLATGLKRLVRSARGNAVGVTLGKLVSVLRNDAKACYAAWEHGKLNHASHIIRQHVVELYKVQAQSGEQLVLGNFRHTWLLSKQGAKMLAGMLAVKYVFHCTS